MSSDLWFDDQSQEDMFMGKRDVGGARAGGGVGETWVGLGLGEGLGRRGWG